MKEDIALHFKGGGSIVSHRPVFSADGESIFICWKNLVLEYNTKTGKLIHEYKGLLNRIIGFSYHSYDSYQCITACSENGKVIVWKTITSYKIMEKELLIPSIKTFNIIPPKNEDELKAFISYKFKNQIAFAVVNVKNRSLKKAKLMIESDEYFIDISGQKYFSVAQENSLYFVHFDNLKSTSSYFMNNRTFTCIACHPSEEVVLTGDNTGRVVVWQNIFANNITQAVFHWHTLPVRTVSFSTAGSYFYSGGEECVLVKWQFEDENDRRFLPRMSAEIEQVCVANNNLYVAVSTSDNGLRILDSQMDQVTLIQHMVLGKHHDSGIVYDPRTKSLVMNGNHGQVQFYHPTDMTLLYNVDVVGQNKITNERDCKIQNTEVTKVAISKNGHWLATIEERKDKEFYGEVRLKFWKFNSEIQKFELNTSVEYPHERSVYNILFQPMNSDDGLRCVTVGNDKKFKVWQLDEKTTIYKKGVAWACLSVGFYRDLRCSALSFSVDGSLMAIGFESILTTWTPDSCELKCSLLHPNHKEKIKYVEFGYSNQCHLLVSASANQLSVWNLLTLSMIWTVPVKVASLLADSLSTHLAVLTQNKKVFVFSPISPDPIYSSDNLLGKQAEIVAATFIPSKYSNDARLEWYERSHLYFINSKNELYCVSKNEFKFEILDDILLDDSRSTFGMMIPQTGLNQAQPATPTTHLYERDVGHKTLKKYLEAPIQTMAPIRFTCHSLLKSLVVQKEIVNI